MRRNIMFQSLKKLFVAFFIFILILVNSATGQCTQNEMHTGGSVVSTDELGNAKISESQSILLNPIEVKRDDGSIVQYYLHLKNPKSHTRTLLVILQGSDCNSIRKIKAIPRLRKVYLDADLLTVEKYGITEALSYSDEVERKDCPEVYLLHDHPEQRASDLDKVICTLRKNYHYSKIIVMGGSEGAIVANIITAQADYIDATVVFGSGGRFFLDDLLYSMKFSGLSKEELNRNIEGFKQFAEHILSHEPFELSMSNHGYLWWRKMLSLDQEELLAKIETPVLILQGEEDQSVSPTKATEMVKSLQAKGKTNIDYYLYPAYNHSLNLSSDDNSFERVIEDIKNWLSNKVL
ncbi:prolyl oligopeptidase family serine peptidase [Iocasia frigidifontis]|uniref:Prolyl oligopeptidase family serine peptidase n=2 Tax=Iocasia fonsfrigidae TaxID=2682810 RepID=A0A8A7K970_9FIRM|nr:prolyl oligopeptidase family serine peptidase [Iocasia fonsfrigidae]